MQPGQNHPRPLGLTVTDAGIGHAPVQTVDLTIACLPVTVNLTVPQQTAFFLPLLDLLQRLLAVAEPFGKTAPLSIPILTLPEKRVAMSPL